MVSGDPHGHGAGVWLHMGSPRPASRMLEDGRTVPCGRDLTDQKMVGCATEARATAAAVPGWRLEEVARASRGLGRKSIQRLPREARESA